MMAPPPREFRAMKPNFWADCWAVYLTFYVVIGTFSPPETFFAPNIPGTYEVALIPLPITPVLLVITCLGLAGALWPLMSVRQLVHEPVAYLFVAWAFASMSWSGDYMLSFQRALRLVPVAGTAVLLAQIYSPQRILRLMLIGFLLSALASIFVSTAVPSYGLSRMTGGYETAWRGALPHKNAAGFIYAVGVLLSLFAWHERASGGRLAVATMVACLVMVAMAQSGTAILGLCAALGPTVILMALRNDDPALRLVAVAMAVMAALSVALMQSFLAELIEAMGRDPTLTGRTGIWDAVWPRLFERPLTGFGYAFWSIDSSTRDAIWREIGMPAPHSHNSWIDVAMQLGWPGFALVVLMTGRVLYRSAGGLVLRGHPLAPMAFSIVMVVLVRTVSEAQFTEPSTVGMFWLMWGYLICRPETALAFQEQRPRIPAGAREPAFQ